MARLVLFDYKMSYFENNCAKRCLGLSIVSFAIVLFSLLMPTPQAFAQCTTICFDAASGPTDLSTYTPGDVAIIRVTDPVFAGNGNSDTVIVTVSSADFLGTPIDNVLLTLTEVGDTGIFKNKALTFSYTHTNYQVNSFDIPSNTVTVSYGATIATVDIDPSSQGGGSGTGGLLVPGTVLEFIYSLGLGGSPYIVSPPSFGGGYYHYSDGLTLTQGDT